MTKGQIHPSAGMHTKEKKEYKKTEIMTSQEHDFNHQFSVSSIYCALTAVVSLVKEYTDFFWFCFFKVITGRANNCKTSAFSHSVEMRPSFFSKYYVT